MAKMGTKRRRVAWIVLAAGILCPSLCMSIVSTIGKGMWPDTWPKELEDFRNQAKTVCVGHGIQETVYEIKFVSRENFEEVWPHILKVKSKGAPLILESSPSKYSVSGSELEVGVRILYPSGGRTRKAGGEMLQAGPPWPDYLKSRDGKLPEYVIADKTKWVPVHGSPGGGGGFHYRARVDIVLVTDGEIVDLNRIRLPRNTPIIDRRKLGDEQNKPKADQRPPTGGFVRGR